MCTYTLTDPVSGKGLGPVCLAYLTYSAAVIVGQHFGLHMGNPLFWSVSWMTLIIPSRRRYCSTTMRRSEASVMGHSSQGDHHTLMCKPLSFLDVFRFCCQCHEIALHDQIRVFFPEEERRFTRDLCLRVAVHRDRFWWVRSG